MNRSLRSLSALVFLCTALLFVNSSKSNAQTFRGTILGSVTDASGSSVPGATVTIKNVDTGLARTVTTSDDGSYSAPELPIGNYTVTVEKAGFKIGVATGTRVDVSTERRVDFTLQPGNLTQKIEVVGEELPMVESTSNTLGGIVESNIVNSLPVNGRDYQKLIYLVPGVAGSPDEISDSPGSYGTFSVNGARGRSNNFLLDGTDMNDGYRNDPAINEAGVFGTPATILPVEAVAELRVASNFEAEYGRSGGAVINIVTNSGTNQWHGSALEYFRNTVLDARNYFNPAASQPGGGPQQPFHNNQFGGSFGGPILKDKTFFFADYEGLRESGSQSSRACVPTAQNIIDNTPTAGINTVIQKLISAGKAWPTATDSNPADCYDNGGTNTTLATPFTNRVDSVIGKIDHNFNKNNLLTGRYYFGDSVQSFPLALSGGGLVRGYNTYTPTRVQLVSVSFVTVMTPSMVNEARLGWNRFAEGFLPEDRNFDPSSIGLDTVGAGTPNNGDTFNFGLPVMTVSGPGASFPQLGADKADPRHRVDSNWHFIDNISWKTGKHDIKFGYEFRRTSISQVFDRSFRGRLNFNSLADFLAGTPTGSGSKNSQNTGDSNRNTSENSHAFYLQDSFRVNRNVTVNLGLRYDYFGIVQEKHGMFDNFDPATGNLFSVGSGRLYQPDYNNWAPRLSVAWDVTGKGRTVVRAGYGIFYDAFSQDMFLGHLPYTTTFAPGPAYSGLAGVGQITTGVPTGDAFAAGVPVYTGYSPVPDAFGVDPHIRTPYIQNFNLNLQQQLTRQMVLQLGYVGSTGHKLFDFRDLNQPTPAAISAYNYAENGCCIPGAVNGSTFRNLLYWQESAANSTYHSLQVSWRINGWHGLTTTLNYTWSHSIDDASDGEDYVPNAAQPTDSTNLSGNRGNSNFDVRQRLTWNFVYEFPNSKDSSLKLLRNGWGLNGIVTVQSGQPFHLIYTLDDYDGSGSFFAKPDVVGPIKYNYHDPTQFLDLSSFAVPCTLDGVDVFAQNCVFQNGKNSMHFGNEGRNSLVGPNFRQFDFSIFKKTQLAERLNMELRFEAYNFFNHPNFASPLYPGFLAAADFNGIGTTGRSSGFYPLTVTGDVGIGYPFLGGGGPRSMQLAVHFTF
jgi:hypothetical protein